MERRPLGCRARCENVSGGPEAFPLSAIQCARNENDAQGCAYGVGGLGEWVGGCRCSLLEKIYVKKTVKLLH